MIKSAFINKKIARMVSVAMMVSFVAFVFYHDFSMYLKSASAAIPDPDKCGTTNYLSMDGLYCSGTQLIVKINFPSAPDPHPNPALGVPLGCYDVMVNGVHYLTAAKTSELSVAVSASSDYTWSVVDAIYNTCTFASSCSSSCWLYGGGGYPNGSFYIASRPNNGLTYYTIGPGESRKQIKEHGIFRILYNTSGNTYFIPTQTSAEWQAFINNRPPGITMCP